MQLGKEAAIPPHGESRGEISVTLKETSGEGGSLKAGERSFRRGSYRQNRETASLPIRVLNAASSPSFSAAGIFLNKVIAPTGSPPAPWGTSPVGSPLGQAEGTPLRYGGLGADPAAASFFYSPTGLLSGPAFLEGQLRKAKPSSVAPPFLDLVFRFDP